MRRTLAVAAALAVVAAASAALVTARASNGTEVSFPKGYRNWHHVKSLILNEGHPLFESFGGLHHIYANDKARKGLDTGRYADGAVFVFDLLETVPSETAVAEGPRKVLGVMERNARRFAGTGGWGFEGFAAGDPAQPVVGANAVTACFQCHESQKDAGYVFSEWRN